MRQSYLLTVLGLIIEVRGSKTSVHLVRSHNRSHSHLNMCINTIQSKHYPPRSLPLSNPHYLMFPQRSTIPISILRRIRMLMGSKWMIPGFMYTILTGLTRGSIYCFMNRCAISDISAFHDCLQSVILAHASSVAWAPLRMVYVTLSRFLSAHALRATWFIHNLPTDNFT
jgi:hypothetical protein